MPPDPKGKQMHRTLSALALAAALALSASQAAAQPTRLTCVQPAEAKGACELTLPRDPGSAVIVVKLEQNGAPVPGANVQFSAADNNNGTLVTPGVTDSRGEATTTWSGAAPATVTARTSIGGQDAMVSIQVKAPDSSTPLTLAYVEGDGQSWYEKRQLKDTLVVEIRNAGDADKCRAAKVAFRPVGTGATSPDTVRGSWDVATSRCTASARWRLQEGVGVQHLRAELTGAAPVMFRANARALPRITLGMALSDPGAYHRIARASDTVTVAQNFGDSVVTRKRVISRDTLDSENPKLPVTPTIGFDWPLIPQVHGLRVSAAASIADPDKDWFFGVSVLQPFFGLSHEANGVTLNFVAHVNRREEVKDAQACRFRRECDTDDVVRFVSLGAMFTIAQTDLFGALTTIFGIK
jgi:hypothetical protein